MPDRGENPFVRMPFLSRSAWWLAAPFFFCPASGELAISEFLADNGSGLTDSFGEASDWIEIWNSGNEPVSTGGWFLSDDPDEPTLWPLPDFMIGAGEYRLIFASGRDLGNPADELHTNFKLGRLSPGNLLLSRMEPDTSVSIVSSYLPYPDQFEDTSYGLALQDGSGTTAYFSEPTPGTANSMDSVDGFVDDTKFSVNRGLYDAPLSVVITSATPGSTLIYTTDGSWPDETNGTQISAPSGTETPSATVAITTTTCLRAMAVKPGFQPTDVDSHTYIFPAHVLQQNGLGAPFDQAVDWGHAGPDWEMDPQIVSHPDPEIRPVSDDLKRIPTLSISMNFDEMFGSGGIYIAGQDVEKNVSIELLNPEDNVAFPNEAEGFQLDGTVQIVGGSSPNRWKSDNLSLRLKFDRDLRFPVLGEDATDRFDTLVLDAQLGECWHYGGEFSPATQQGRAQYARDQFAADLHREIGGFSPHGRHVLLYINGIFWGMRTLHERPDDDFAASYMGGDKDDYDVVKHNINTVVSGSRDSYVQLHSLADQDLSIQGNFDRVAELLDIDAFIDYIILNYFLGNTDWGHQNWYASRNHTTPEGKWQFHSWDAENVMNYLTDNVTGRSDSGGPTNLQQDLSANAEYRLRFADRVHHHLHHGGAMTPERTLDLYARRTAPIFEVIRLESARWGDNQRAQPYTRLDWLANRERFLGVRTDGDFGDYFNRRPEIFLNQLRSRGWYPNTEPPAFSSHGGRFPGGTPITLSSPSPGTIYYTTDGSDPRVSASGEVVDSVTMLGEFATKRALVPTSGLLGTAWTQSGFDDSAWPAGTLGAGYENSVGGDYESLIDPNLDFAGVVNGSNFESIYLRAGFTYSSNPDLNVLRLGLRYDDGFIAYLNGVEVARQNAPGNPGEPAAWNSQATTTHDDSEAVEFHTFDISDHLGLLVPGNNVLAVHALNRGASSSDFLIWPTLEGLEIEGGANGVAETAVPYEGDPLLLDQTLTLKARVLNGGEWSPVTEADFVVDAVAPTPSNLVVSKIHYHPLNPTSAEIAAGYLDDGDFEYIELKNASSDTLDLSGVHFNEGIQFGFDASSVHELAPGARVLIVRNATAFAHRYGSGLPVAGEFEDDTALGNGGEFLALMDQDGGILQRFEYLDDPPWPLAPDGGGPALVLVNPDSAPDHSLAGNWTSSISWGGNPGEAENDDPLRALLAQHFTPAEMTDGSLVGLEIDPDGDGMTTLLELFFGTDPTVPDHGSANVAIIINESGVPELKITCREDLSAFVWHLESSPDLDEWADATDAFTITEATGLVTLTAMSSPDGQEPGFYRVVVEPAE